MATVTRSFEFDAGHRVLGHRGKCRFIHGHRYRVEVEVESFMLDELDMVVDFSVIKEKVGNWIDENWDHRLLLNPNDPQVLRLTETEEVAPYVMAYGNPTAENIAHEIFDVARRLLSGLFRVTSVRVWETPSCSAGYSVDSPDNKGNGGN